MAYSWKPWIADRQNAFTLMVAAADSLDAHGREEQAKELRRRCISEAQDPEEMRVIIKEYVSVCEKEAA